MDSNKLIVFPMTLLSVAALYSYGNSSRCGWTLTPVLRGQQYENQLADHQKCNTGEINISYQRRRKKERKNWQGHGSAHGEEIKGGAALWGQRER